MIICFLSGNLFIFIWKEKHVLVCAAGIRKVYWITCNVDPDIQQLSLDKGRYNSNFVVRPRDLNRLLANFQSSLQEITIIATERSSLPSDAVNEIGGKAVELRSYLDPTKGTNILSIAMFSQRLISHARFFFFFYYRKWLIVAHSAVDRSCWRICSVYS